jgi:integrase
MSKAGKVRHLVARVKGGREYFYWQPAQALRLAGWRMQALPGDRAQALAKAEALNLEVDAWRRGEVAPNAPAAAAKRGRRAAAGSVEALIQDYKVSRFWLALADRTRKEYGWALDVIAAWAGDMPARAITAPAVQAFYAGQLRRVEGSGKARRVVETPARAAAVVRVLRLLLGVGERLGYLAPGANPAHNPGLVVRRKRDPVLWSPAAVQHMAAVADRLGWRSIGTAILLNEWLGQREADVLALPPWQQEGGAIVLRQGKTGRRVVLPVHLVPHLVARLKGEAARPDAVQGLARLLVHDKTGQGWNEHTFRHTFAAIRDIAAKGLPADPDLGLAPVAPMPGCAQLRFAELRHTAATRLHEAGVDEQGIATITGHTPGSVRAILDRHYLVRTERGAEAAFKRRLAAEEQGNG